ncbi:MAG: NAD(+)/NADH kinase [Deltaproteobacteria bacterium]|nr:MAG: NAD(+)/NADH kinase [Deltaproteobacteria bacterium]
MRIEFNPKNPKAFMLNAFLQAHLDPERVEPDLVLVLGGDGFMLHVVRRLQAENPVFLGLNCGNLGFMLNEIPPQVEALIPIITERKYHVLEVPRIHLEAVDREGRVHEADAMNDIYLERMTGQSAHLELAIDGLTVVDCIVCDGLILATALGSTSYNFSAGGAICHPTLPVLNITPICPHSPRLTPMVFPLQTIVRIDARDHEKRKVRAVNDGVDIDDVVQITVQAARQNVKLAFFQKNDFTGRLFSKLLKTR